MTHRISVILIMISAMILAGCQVDTMPMDVSNFTTTRAATQETAMYNGMYRLYDDNNDEVVGPILMSRHLKQGEIVGFEIDANHAPFAIAGKDRLLLATGRYRWQMTADSGQPDWKQTNTVIIEVVIATAVVALIVVSTIAATKGL